MQEQILMSYADLRNRGTEQEISQSGQQFIEIDNPVRTTGLDTLTNVVNAIDTLRIKLTRLLAGVGRKLGLTKRFTGAWMLRLKNPGKRRELLLPTSTSTTS